MVRPRVFLADDHTPLVDLFRRLLEPEFEIVGVAFSGPVLFEKALNCSPT
jgi:CheY-like chemotaxis protein